MMVALGWGYFVFGSVQIVFFNPYLIWLGVGCVGYGYEDSVGC